MQVASTYVRKLFEITKAVRKWFQYLLGRRFQIFTDQKSLKHLLLQVVQTPEQYKWASKLIGFDFEIIYKPGKENDVADALSRIEDEIVLALSTVDLTWKAGLCTYYHTEPGQQLVQNLTGQTNTSKVIVFCDVLLYQQHHLFIPEIESLRSKIPYEYHSSPIGGYSGIHPNIRRLTSTFCWPKLRDDVKEFIKCCEICQQTKYPTHKPYRLLQPVSVLAQVWSDISMDFITHLRSSYGK